MANIFDQFDVNTPTKNVTSTPNIFDQFDDDKVNGGTTVSNVDGSTTVSNIPQIKDFPKKIRSIPKSSKRKIKKNRTIFFFLW